LLYRGVIWRGEKCRSCVYLTFDDGPIPEVTPAVLEILGSRGAKATFFCVGENVEKHPEVYSMLAEHGMQTGNHTYSHSRPTL
jgi:peptidoglycan/xylan/chitin deacetylase (PgdA/CDA1 family)